MAATTPELLEPSQPSETAAGIQTPTATKEKPKATFLTLPQELRDHIYSFLPLKCDGLIIMGSHENLPSEKAAVKTAASLAKSCRTTHADMQKAYWSANKFYHSGRDWALLASVKHITNLEFTVPHRVEYTTPNGIVSSVSAVAGFHLVKQDNRWCIRALPCPYLKSGIVWLGSGSLDKKVERLLVKRGAQACLRLSEKVREAAGVADGLLQQSDCITLEVLQSLCAWRRG